MSNSGVGACGGVVQLGLAEIQRAQGVAYADCQSRLAIPRFFPAELEYGSKISSHTAGTWGIVKIMVPFGSLL